MKVTLAGMAMTSCLMRGHPILGRLESAADLSANELDNVNLAKAAYRLRKYGDLRDTSCQRGILEQASLMPRTRAQYSDYIEKFMRAENMDTLEELPTVLDAKMVHHMDRMFLEGKAAGAGEKLLAAVQYYVPAYGSRGEAVLPRAVRALRGWRRLVPSRTRRPLPWCVVAGIATGLMRKHGVDYALCWLLMVDAYLRPGECIGLRPSQLLKPTAQEHMTNMAIILHRAEDGVPSKTGAVDESLLVHRPWLSTLLIKYAESRPESGRLWKFDLPQMREKFLDVCLDLELQEWNPVLYMGRHTGASLDRLENRVSLSEVQKRGRWRSTASVRRYEKRALIQEVYNSLSAGTRRFCLSSEKQLVVELHRHVDRLRSARRLGSG